MALCMARIPLTQRLHSALLVRHFVVLINILAYLRRYIGTSVYVYGTVAPTTVPAVTNYTIDGGVPFNFVAPIVDFAAGDVCFYQSPNLVDGVHTLVITNLADDAAFWFDYLSYK